MVGCSTGRQRISIGHRIEMQRTSVAWCCLLSLYVNRPNSCCICGEMTQSSTKNCEPIYKNLYFECKVGIPGKTWVANFVTIFAQECYPGQLRTTHKSMKFKVPMISRDAQNLVDDFYISFTKILLFSSNSKQKN